MEFGPSLKELFAFAEAYRLYALAFSVCFIGLILFVRAVTLKRYRLLIGWAVLAIPLVVFYCIPTTIYVFDPRIAERAEMFARPVKYADVPADARTLVLYGKADKVSHFGRCLEKCLTLLLGGRFDRVAFNSTVGPFNNERTAGFQVYSIVKQAGCKSTPLLTEIPSSVRTSIVLWELKGVCIRQDKVTEIEGPRLEVRVDGDAPGNPPWRVIVFSVSHHDGTSPREIYRSERGTGDLPSGFRRIFTQIETPKGVWLDGDTWNYGSRWHNLEEVIKFEFDRGIDRPKFADFTPELQLEYAVRVFRTSSARLREEFVVNEIGVERMLTGPYRELFRELAKKTTGYDAAWIARAASRDAELTKEVLPLFIDRIEQKVELPEAIALSLRSFPREHLLDMKPRLLALSKTRPYLQNIVAELGE